MPIQLLTPLNFIRIRFFHRHLYLCVIPCAFAVVLTLLYYISGGAVSLLGRTGMVQRLNELLPILIGFYIAALAAVATMQQDRLDQYPSGECPTLTRRRRGEKIKEDLTRRRFLSYLFSYMAFLSVMLYVAGIVSPFAASLYSNYAGFWFAELLKAVLLMTYLFAYGNLLSGTMFGLHYFADRIHRDE